MSWQLQSWATVEFLFVTTSDDDHWIACRNLVHNLAGVLLSQLESSLASGDKGRELIADQQVRDYSGMVQLPCGSNELLHTVYTVYKHFNTTLLCLWTVGQKFSPFDA